jgi:hypothetical protein
MHEIQVTNILLALPDCRHNAIASHFGQRMFDQTIKSETD